MKKLAGNRALEKFVDEVETFLLLPETYGLARELTNDSHDANWVFRAAAALASAAERDPLFALSVARMASGRSSGNPGTPLWTTHSPQSLPETIALAGVMPPLKYALEMWSVGKGLDGNPAMIENIVSLAKEVGAAAKQVRMVATARGDEPADIDRAVFDVIMKRAPDLYIANFAAVEWDRLLAIGERTPETEREVLGFTAEELRVALHDIGML